MNTNFDLIKVIQNEKLQEIRNESEKLSLLKLISRKDSENKDNPSRFVEKLHEVQNWLTIELQSLRWSSK